MSVSSEPYAIVFPEWYGGRAEFEAPFKGHLSGVVVRLENGPSYNLCFTDRFRLQQTLEDEFNAGREYYMEPGLFVIPEVTTEAIRTAIRGLWRDGYFQYLKHCE